MRSPMANSISRFPLPFKQTMRLPLSFNSILEHSKSSPFSRWEGIANSARGVCVLESRRHPKSTFVAWTWSDLLKICSKASIQLTSALFFGHDGTLSLPSNVRKSSIHPQKCSPFAHRNPFSTKASAWDVWHQKFRMFFMFLDKWQFCISLTINCMFVCKQHVIEAISFVSTDSTQLVQINSFNSNWNWMRFVAQIQSHFLCGATHRPFNKQFNFSSFLNQILRCHSVCFPRHFFWQCNKWKCWETHVLANHLNLKKRFMCVFICFGWSISCTVVLLQTIFCALLNCSGNHLCGALWQLGNHSFLQKWISSRKDDLHWLAQMLASLCMLKLVVGGGVSVQKKNQMKNEFDLASCSLPMEKKTDVVDWKGWMGGIPQGKCNLAHFFQRCISLQQFLIVGLGSHEVVPHVTGREDKWNGPKRWTLLKVQQNRIGGFRALVH